ncbi:MAG TPA: carboxypeptidase-like regulatory domain-containing protein [Solirubrobacteraceae bacterium]|jgi:hypothetical protein
MVPAVAGAAVSLVLALSASAVAAPITVNLRVEGATKTLYEGPISAEPIEPPGIEPPVIETEDTSPGMHPCDVKYNGENGGFGAAAPTPIAALYEAALTTHLSFAAGWFSSLNDFRVEQVGEDIANSGSNGEFWGDAVNFTTAEIGGCQIRLAPGSEVLWAYNFFGLSHLLSLTGPSTVNAGVPFTVHVTDGQTGEPISGASIGQLVNGVTNVGSSSPTTNAAGNATITLAQVGTVTFKATQSESVRSNGLSVTANSAACTCDLVVPPPAPKLAQPNVAKAAGIKNGHVYSRRSAPRLLAGIVEVPSGSTLRQVRISLQRRYRGRCFDFSGSRERFVRSKKCGSAAFFSVGGSESFSYLLPSRLPKGRYTYDIQAVNSAGQPTELVSGISHVVFQVK